MAEEKIPGIEEAEKGAITVRDTAKWLITAFAAVGAALIAGTQVSGLGNLEHFQRIIAVSGLLTGFFGVAWAIWLTVKVITPENITLTTIRQNKDFKAVLKFVGERIGLLKTTEDVEKLEKEYFEALNDRQMKWEKYLQKPSQATLLEAVKIADARAQYLSGRVRQVIALGTYEYLRVSFKEKLLFIFVAGTVAVCGIVTFASVSRPSESDRFRTPELLSMSLTERGRQFVGEVAGENCVPVKGMINVVGIKEQGGSWEVITIPTDKCKTTRFKMTESLGSVIPARSFREEPVKIQPAIPESELHFRKSDSPNSKGSMAK